MSVRVRSGAFPSSRVPRRALSHFTSRPARALGVNKTYRPERRCEHLPDASPSTPERLPPTPAIVPVLNHPSDVSSAHQVACTVNRAVLCAGCDELTRHTAGGQPRVPLLSFSLADDALRTPTPPQQTPVQRGLYLPAVRRRRRRRAVRSERREALARLPRSLAPGATVDGTPPPPPPSSRSNLPFHHQVGQVAQPPRGSVRAGGTARGTICPGHSGEGSRRRNQRRDVGLRVRIQLVERERPHRAVQNFDGPLRRGSGGSLARPAARVVCVRRRRRATPVWGYHPTKPRLLSRTRIRRANIPTTRTQSPRISSRRRA